MESFVAALPSNPCERRFSGRCIVYSRDTCLC